MSTLHEQHRMDADEQECHEAFETWKTTDGGKAVLAELQGRNGWTMRSIELIWWTAWNARAETDGWQPIETAPRDGSPFIGFAPDDPGGTVGEAYSQLDTFRWMDGHCAKLKKWRPLPDPPEDSP